MKKNLLLLSAFLCAIDPFQLFSNNLIFPFRRKSLNLSKFLTLSFLLIFLFGGAQTTQTFHYTGANQTFTVPAGVTSISVKAWGAGGAGAYTTGGSGGSGALVKGTLAVTPGQSYIIVVGGGGTYSTGGFGGGGDAGPNQWGGSGGGYSALFLNPVSQNNTKLLAGGGGGGGYFDFVTNGGGGGAVNGTGGGNTGYIGYNSGGGGITATGGTGGLFNNAPGNQRSGVAGIALSGGAASQLYNYGGGGGGGGYFGGGGGYSSNSNTYYSSGGGGGSSYVTGLTAITNTAGITNQTGSATQAPGNGETGYLLGVGNGGASGISGLGGDGLIIITYTLPCPTFASTISIGGNTNTAGSLYPSLTAAFADLSRCSINKATLLSLKSNYNSTAETFPIVIPSITGSSTANTLTIKPAAGVAASISGSSATPLIQINGESNFIIDGSNVVNGLTRDLTITNTSLSSGGVVLIGSPNTTPVANVILKNSIINNGTNTTSAVIISSSTTSGSAGYFKNITVQNNSISKAYIGLYAIAAVATNNGDGLLITGNDLSSTGVNSIRLVGVYVQGVDGLATISSNNIGNISNSYGESPIAIWIATATNNAILNNNVITNVNSNVSGSFTANGILISSGVSTVNHSIYNNTISGISSFGSYVDGATGIEIAGETQNISLYNNKISNVKNSYASGQGSAGIFLGSSSTTANTLVYNNMVCDVAGKGNTSTFANGHGLYAYSGSGYKIYYNSVNMATDQTSGKSSAFYVFSNIAAIGAVDLRNNIFANNQTTNTRYAIYSDAPKTVFSNIDYNDYYSTGNVGYLGTNQPTLVNWQTAAGADANSLNIVPPFLSATDLHLTGCSVLESSATPITGITTDVDADLRSSTNPDIGAYESKMFFTGAYIPTPTLWNVNNNWSSFNLPTSDKCVNIAAGKTVFVDMPNAVAKKVTVSSGGRLTINQNQTLTVTNELINNNPNTNLDYVTVASDGNLIQINNTTNTGNVSAKRAVTNLTNNGTSKVDYVYWGSPVNGQNLQIFSPLTPANMFLSYRESNDRFYQTADSQFQAGKGYAIQAETGVVSKDFTFTGVPNNGDISIPIIKSADNPVGMVHGYNLVGNPYPSNISFDALYAGNPGLLVNTVWFWKNNSYTATQQGSNYAGNNYVVFNGTGGNPIGANGTINVGQGFIIQKKSGGTANLNFANSMRTIAAGTFSQRSAAKKNRFWLSLVNPENTENSQLIGYVEGATNNFEQDYDAEAFSDYADLFYSKLEDKKLLIQGRSSDFNLEDRVPLGANFFENGVYKIELQKGEGLFANGQNIYLKDNVANTVTNLSENPYTFQAAKGLSDGRFEIVYKPESVLGTNQSTMEELLVYRSNEDFLVKAKTKKITGVEVYNAAGNLLYNFQPNNTQATIPAQYLIRGVYILKINQGTQVTTKKVIR